MFLVKTMTVFTSKKKYRYSIQITLFHWLSGCFFYQFLIVLFVSITFLMVGILKEQNVNKTMLYEFPLLHAKQKYLIKFLKNVEIDIISSSSFSFLQTLAPVCTTSHCQGVCKPLSNGGLLCETNGELPVMNKKYFRMLFLVCIQTSTPYYMLRLTDDINQILNAKQTWIKRFQM